MSEQLPPNRQEMKICGNQLVATVKNLIHEGNIRRIQVKQEGRIVLELPLTAVAVGVLIAPVAAALGAFAALATECTIVVERESGSGEPPAQA